MKNYLPISFVIFLFLVACEDKVSETRSGSLVLTGINSAKGNEMVTIDLDSGYVSTAPVSCYVLSSTVYDPNSGGYGYVSCDTVFTLTDPESGVILKSIKVPGLLSEVVIDKERSLLTGTYREYEETPDPDSSKLMILHTYLFTQSLATGDIILDKEVDLGDGVILCTQFFDPIGRYYVLERSDKTLLFINPVTGETSKTVEIGKVLTNIVYNTDDGNIIAMRFDSESERCYIDVNNTSSGKLLSSSLVDGMVGYRYCMAAYDPVTGCYLTVNSNDEVVFIVPATGEIKKRVKLDYALSNIKFMRKQEKISV